MASPSTVCHRNVGTSLKIVLGGQEAGLTKNGFFLREGLIFWKHQAYYQCPIHHFREDYAWTPELEIILENDLTKPDGYIQHLDKVGLMLYSLRIPLE
ncbi:hypothetical protein IAQ61_010914 [Plenodomus lingam]|uniref:uncharacterized protein n=1 Tax=Leptosphaeria maculans TaxID=5022 RepID=UPI00332F864B|nr:hypothetical protein IAQ61_010914 [Plenodomus lingam]